MNDALRSLLGRLIDYAGLFPPAGLPMAEAVTNYAVYQRRSDHWALGRFVVPAVRLPEFEHTLMSLSPADRLGTRWPLTALIGPDPVAELGLVAGFNERHQHGGPQVLSLESRGLNVARIAELGGMVGGTSELYLELPLGDELPDLVAAVKRVGARAKIRTGGVSAADFPAPEAVLGFLRACAGAQLAFKATAGLHHPVRGPAPLTYKPDAQQATMYGYLNLFLAAVLLWHGRPEREALDLLTRQDRERLQFTGSSISWGGVSVTAAEVVAARRDFALSVGSCSFTEPLDEIESLVAATQAARGRVGARG